MMNRASLAAIAVLLGNPAWGQTPRSVADILNDACHAVDFSGNSDRGASRGEQVLTRVNKPSGYSLIAGGAVLTKTATMGSAEFSDANGLIVRLVSRPDGEDYFDASGTLVLKRTAIPGQDVFTDSAGRALLTATTPDGETTRFTCADGSSCLTLKLRPWGDEFFVGEERILLRAACPGGDVFYGEGAPASSRALVRVAAPGGGVYYRSRSAPELPDIVRVLKLDGDARAWRAILFDYRRGLTLRRVIWPIPSPLY